MTIRLLADREPYLSFADEGSDLVILNGPPDLDDSEADFFVLPAADFLACAQSFERRRRGARWIAYGPVSLMQSSFDSGAADYLREPWSLPELRARVSRFLGIDFRVGDSTLRLSGSTLRGPEGPVTLTSSELAFLRILLQSAPLPVTKDAAAACLGLDTHSLARLAVALRHKLDQLHLGLGAELHTVRGLGYRLDVFSCG